MELATFLGAVEGLCPKPPVPIRTAYLDSEEPWRARELVGEDMGRVWSPGAAPAPWTRIPVCRFVVYGRGMLAEDDWPTLKELQRCYSMDRAIEHKNGNKTRAALLLGIDRRTLNRILAREGALNTAPLTRVSSDATRRSGSV